MKLVVSFIFFVFIQNIFSMDFRDNKLFKTFDDIVLDMEQQDIEKIETTKMNIDPDFNLDEVILGTIDSKVDYKLIVIKPN